jgi:hypothetical protein
MVVDVGLMVGGLWGLGLGVFVVGFRCGGVYQNINPAFHHHFIRIELGADQGTRKSYPIDATNLKPHNINQFLIV